MSSILNSPDILAALQQRKKLTEQKLQASRVHIMESANQFWSPLPKTTSRAQYISHLVSNGVIIYNGFRIFTSILSAFRSLFGSRKKRRR